MSTPSTRHLLSDGILLTLQMELLALFDSDVPKILIENFQALNSSPSSWDFSLVRCPLIADREYEITQIVKEVESGVIFHLVHTAFNFDTESKYVLPPHYAQLVTDGNVREVNSRRAPFTLRKRFVKDDWALLKHKGQFVKSELVLSKTEVFIE